MSKQRNKAADVQLNPNQRDTVDGRPSDISAQISVRAFEIFAGRGYQPGHDLDDWLLAEGQMLGNRVDALVDSWSK